MQVARTAAPGADREVAGEMCLGPRREGGDLFVPHVNPFDFAVAANRVGDAVETVAHDAEYALDAGRCQGLDELIRYRSGHTVLLQIRGPSSFSVHYVGCKPVGTPLDRGSRISHPSSFKKEPAKRESSAWKSSRWSAAAAVLALHLAVVALLLMQTRSPPGSRTAAPALEVTLLPPLKVPTARADGAHLQRMKVDVGMSLAPPTVDFSSQASAGGSRGG